VQDSPNGHYKNLRPHIRSNLQWLILI